MKRFLAAFTAALFLTGTLTAADNKKCPVSGKDIDASKTTKVSVTVGFCCAKCQGKFEKDDKAKSEALSKYAGSKDSPANAKCIYQGGKDAKSENTVTVDKEVAFCCDKCKATFEADPKKYIDKVK